MEKILADINKLSDISELDSDKPNEQPKEKIKDILARLTKQRLEQIEAEKLVKAIEDKRFASMRKKRKKKNKISRKSRRTNRRK